MRRPPPHDAGTFDSPIAEVLARRFSCRAFLPDEVPAETLREIFTVAQLTPSWCNSQAWEVELLSGDATRELADALTARARSGAPASDLVPPTSYDGVYRERRRDSGVALYQAVGIARDDMEGRVRQAAENLRFFGSPHVAIISTPKALGTYGAVDCGGYVATLMTVAQSLGVDSIAQAAVAMYSDLLHDHLDIPTDRDVVCAVALGYADPTHPANAFRTTRAPVATVVRGLPPAPA